MFFQVLKNVQLSTRILQSACNQARIFRDASLSQHVPMLKKLLETLVYRVKSMLAVNSALDAFWMGTLKTRDLAGAEVKSVTSSQTSSSAEQTNEDETVEDEEEVLPEEDESDVELGGEDDSSEKGNRGDESESEMSY